MPQLDALATSSAGMTPVSGGVTPTSTQPVDAYQMAQVEKQGHPIRVAGLFVLAAVGVLAIVYALIQALGLPDWVLLGAVGLMALGLPIMVYTGHAEKRRAVQQATGIYDSAAQKGLHGWFTWRRAILGGLGAFAALGIVTGGYAAMRTMGIGPAATLITSGALGERDKLVLADFENRTSDSMLGESVTEALRIDLSQSSVVKLLDDSEVRAALQRMARDPDSPVDETTAREIAEREGAKAMVLGDISTLGRGFVLSAQVVGAADGAVLTAHRETASDDGEIIDAVDRLSRKLRERVGESLKTIRTTDRLDMVSTSSLAALRLYRNANQAVTDGDADRGIELFQEALAEDSTFAMAWRRLAVVLNNNFGDAQDAADAATMAYQLRDRLPERERQLATAYYYSAVDYDRARVENAYRALVERFPDEGAALNNLANELNGQYRHAEAEVYARQALESGDHWPFYGNLIGALMGQGRDEEAWQVVQDFQASHPGSAHGTRFGVWVSGGERDGATRDSLTDVLQRRPEANWQFWGHLFRVQDDERRGRVRNAGRSLEAMQALDEARGDPSGYLDWATWRASLQVDYLADTVGARAVLDEALAKYPLDSMTAINRPYLSLAEAYTDMGDIETAKTYMAEWQSQVPDGIRNGTGRQFRVQGNIAMAEGRYRDAIDLYQSGYQSGTCLSCGRHEIGFAYDQLGLADSALLVLEAEVESPGLYRALRESNILGASYKRLGELYEDRDRQKALDYYSSFVELWRAADPELQPVVEEVRLRMAELSGEPD
jgi:tetratricopeptide (TPR) repeat protein